MKGLFFINFMVILSCFSVASGILYNYVVQGGRGKKLALLLSGCCALGAGELYLYSRAFPDGAGSIGLTVLHTGALVSVSWFLAFLLAFPVLLILAAGVFLYRLKWRVRPAVPAAGGAAELHRGPSMSRRTFLKGMAAAVPVTAAATSGLGDVIGESYLAVTKLPLSFPHLPDYLEGYRIGQISDTHIGLFFSPEDLKTAMERLAEEKVNRLEITGDLIDELSRLPQCRQVLADGAALFPDGIDFCYGNHEYYRGLADITDMLETTPVRIVRNSHFCASPGRYRFQFRSESTRLNSSHAELSAPAPAGARICQVDPAGMAGHFTLPVPISVLLPVAISTTSSGGNIRSRLSMASRKMLLRFFWLIIRRSSTKALLTVYLLRCAGTLMAPSLRLSVPWCRP